MQDRLIPGIDTMMATLGGHVRAARLARGDTQAVLAERAGVSRATVARLESGDQGVSAGHVLAALEAMGLARQMVDAVAPARDATAPDRLPKRGRTTRTGRDWGEDLF